MNKTIITATNFNKKAYAQPEMKVVEIEQSALLCQSPNSDPEPQSNSSMYEYDLGDGGFSD